MARNSGETERGGLLGIGGTSRAGWAVPGRVPAALLAFSGRWWGNFEEQRFQLAVFKTLDW